MAQYDMLDEHSNKTFSSNTATRLLVRGKEPSLGHMAAHQINSPKADAWKVLPEAVRTGQTAFMLAHNGDTMHQVGTQLLLLCATRAEPAKTGTPIANALRFVLAIEVMQSLCQMQLLPARVLELP